MSDQGSSPLERYARILETLAAAPDGMTLTQIADAAQLRAGTAHRLVNSLCDVGFAERHSTQKTYMLGPRMLRLCHLSLTPPSIISVAEPILQNLVNIFGETAYLARLTDDVVESVAMIVPSASDKAYVQPGRKMPFHAAASAKAIFAFQNAENLNRALAQPRTKFTEDTRIDDDEILAELKAVASDGLAVCDNELDPGVLSYAVPVALDGDIIIYAIGISGLSERLRLHSRDKIRDRLQKAAQTLSGALKRTFEPAV